MYYKQCVLKIGTDKFSKETTTWLPQKFCHVGFKVKLRNNDQWSDYWTITSVSEVRKHESEIKDVAHKSQEIWTATSGKYPRGNK